MAWGTKTGANMPTAPSGDTFALAAAVLATYGAEVEAATWCEIADAGQAQYHSDKAGKTHFWVLQSHIEYWKHSAGYMTYYSCA